MHVDVAVILDLCIIYDTGVFQSPVAKLRGLLRERIWSRKYKQSFLQFTNISDLQLLKLLVLIFLYVHVTKPT
jgi:hypothetical protein